MPHLEKLQSELPGKVKAFKIDAFDNMDVAAQYGVRAVPTVIVFHQGKAAERWVGLTSADKIKAKVEPLVGAK